MATTPVKPSAAPPKPPPPPETVHVNIHGIPPKPNMAESESSVDESRLSESTLAEMEAGRKGLALNQARKEAELEMGKKIVTRLQGNPRE